MDKSTVANAGTMLRALAIFIYLSLASFMVLSSNGTLPYETVELTNTAYTRSLSVSTTLRHKPYNENTVEWRIPSTGPLSGANTAMPGIVFQRDFAAFEKKFQRLRLLDITPLMPFSYILSGGVSLRSLLPGFLYGFIRGVEQFMAPFANYLAMFALIKIRKQ